MDYEFSGISTKQFNEQGRENDFYEVYETILIEKKPFTVELDSKEIKLHLYIEDMDMADYDDCTDHIVSINVVPTFESLSEKNQQSILSQFPEDEHDMILKDTQGLLYEVLCYGFNVPLRSVTVTDLSELEHTINSAIAVRSAVSGLIGFELDRRVNRIGNTGWDFLSSYCEDTDLLKVVMDRYESAKV